MAKRLAFPGEKSQAKKRAPATEGFLAVLARKGQEKYGELLSFVLVTLLPRDYTL